MFTADVSAKERSKRLNVEASFMVLLNVGGEVFTTTTQLLSKFPESVLGSMFSDTFGSGMLNKDPHTNAVFLDLDPEEFRIVLKWMRYGILPSLTPYQLKLLSIVADDLLLPKLSLALQEYGGQPPEKARPEKAEQIEESSDSDCAMFDLFGSDSD
eukprot:TRINITY_DN1544_c0_g1_i4.p1 TRINITY_DN1544_c0_g1~~TRINITY_DN1544_c0_g1_i4.p1  ORF type:complete len:156 (+),score=35.18 TRINITY_DN1544_c0_g1_i4:43-510(+)